MFEGIRPQLKCLEGQGQNSSVLKDRARFLICQRRRPKFEYVKG